MRRQDKTAPRKPRKRMMCPNADCAKFQQPTGMMGGCECGAALVEHYIAPTDDQLENFIYVLMKAEAVRMGLLASDNAIACAVGLTMLDPAKKAMWLRRHRDLQSAADQLGKAA